MSGMPLVSRATRLFAEEMKLTTCPSLLIDGAMLFPFAGAGEVPGAMLESDVEGEQVVVPVVVAFVQVLRTKTFSRPFAAFGDKFDASEANAMNCPSPIAEVPRLMLGFSLRAFPGALPLVVETSVVEVVHVVACPLQVSRT
jgi:hypothetical protein